MFGHSWEVIGGWSRLSGDEDARFFVCNCCLAWRHELRVAYRGGPYRDGAYSVSGEPLVEWPEERFL